MAKSNFKHWDKLITGFLTIFTAFICVISYVAKWPDDVKIGLTVSTSLLTFSELLLFVLDIKFHKMKESILGERFANDNKTIESLNNEFEDLARHNRSTLYVRTHYTTADALSIIESKITKDFFGKPVNSDNEYIIIYVITNANTVELDDFSTVIHDNILEDCQYVYMTNLSDDEFITQLQKRVFKNENNSGITNHLLNAAFAKNIHHISNPSFFVGRPDYSDIVIYAKYQQKRLVANDTIYGYYCYQNGAIEEEIKGMRRNRDKKEIAEHYYYYDLLKENINEILSSFFKDKFWNSVLKSWSSDKIELKDSSINGKGLFAKCQINKDEEIFKMGGYFEPITVERKTNNTYLQIDNKMLLCGTDTEDKNVKFCANHSCTPNCRLKDEITFIALKDISEGEEILVDYATLGNNYCLAFNCENAQCDKHGICNHNISESEKHKKEIQPALPFEKGKAKAKKQINKNSKK